MYKTAANDRARTQYSKYVKIEPHEKQNNVFKDAVVEREQNTHNFRVQCQSVIFVRSYIIKHNEGGLFILIIFNGIVGDVAVAISSHVLCFGSFRKNTHTQ